MTRPPEPPPEGVLIESARRDAKLSVREAARRAGISEGWWRQVVKGYQSLSGGSFGTVRDVPADTVAKMAKAAGVTPEQLEGEGRRPDAAKILREGNVTQFPARRPVPDPADLPPMFQNLPPDIGYWWDDVARDLGSGGVPRTRLEADVWNSPDIQPQHKQLLIAIFRSSQAATARGENPNDRTGLTPPPPRRHLTGVRR
jgi:hypothetical protein